MHHFTYRNNELHVENVPVATIAAEVGTPVYIYSRATLTRHYHAFDNAFHGLDHLVCYSVKSNSSRAVLKLFGDYGGGADVVSGGELYRVLEAGIPADRICFSGVGKTEPEIVQALEAGILMFNVESVGELEAIDRVAGRLGKKAPVAIRVNPDVNPKTHPYISTGMKENKFGLDVDTAMDAYARAAGMDNLEVIGIDCHIGSQLTDLSPFIEALERLKLMIGRLREQGISLRYLDLGGGLGIAYHDEQPPEPLEYATALAGSLADMDLKVILEPGRVIVGNAGILVARVTYRKQTEVKNFLIVDAAMNDLVRPSLYGSFHELWPVRQTGRDLEQVDVVGPICESSDFLAKDRRIEAQQPGDLVALMSAGAYGHIMASNYNSRPRPAEVMVSGDRFAVIRARENYQDLVRGETVPDFLIREGGDGA